MHSEKDEKTLAQLTMKEKQDRVSPDALAKRGSLVTQYTKRYLAENEMPHTDRGDEQYVLRLKKTWVIRSPNGLWLPNRQAMLELANLLYDRKVKYFAKHKEEDCSVDIYHIHLYN